MTCLHCSILKADGVADGLRDFIKQAQLDNVDLAMKATALYKRKVDRSYAQIRQDSIKEMGRAYEALADARYALKQHLDNVLTIIDTIQEHEDFYSQELTLKQQEALDAAELHALNAGVEAAKASAALKHGENDDDDDGDVSM